MTVSACDFMDYVTEALDISVDTEDVSLVNDIAIGEINRLKGIEKLLRDNQQRIIAALMTMQDSDADLGHPDEAKASGDLIEKLKNLPEPDLELEEEEEEEDDPDYDDDGNLKPGVDHES